MSVCLSVGHDRKVPQKRLNPVEMLFAMWTRGGGRRNHAVERGADPPREAPLLGDTLEHAQACARSIYSKYSPE